VPDSFCEDGNSFMANAAVPFDGKCSISNSMVAQCSNLNYSVTTTEAHHFCEKSDGDDAPDLNERICAVLLEGTWLPKTCGEWEADLSVIGGTAGLAGFCAIDPTGGIKGLVDYALAGCCPPGTAAEVCGPVEPGLSMCAEEATFLADNEWQFGGTGETSGECITMRQSCSDAGYVYGDDPTSSNPLDKCVAPDDSCLEMNREVCDRIGGYWEVTTCGAARAGLMHIQNNPEALELYCSNPVYNQYFETALAGCCSAGNRVAMDAFCGDVTMAPVDPTAFPIVPHLCEGGVGMVATTAFFDEGTCSIPNSMGDACRANGWTVRPSACAVIEGQSVCAADSDNATDLSQRECIVLMDGTWVPKTCGEWETEVAAFGGPAVLAGYCASEPMAKTYVDAALATCCPSGTAGDVCGPPEEGGICAYGSNLLGSNPWSMNEDGDPEAAGDCYTTQSTCEGAGYRFDADEDSTVGKCESDDPRMTRTMCDAMPSNGGPPIWEFTTCLDAVHGISQAGPEGLAPYCNNTLHREALGAAMMACCEGGNSNSVAYICGEATLPPRTTSPPPTVSVVTPPTSAPDTPMTRTIEVIFNIPFNELDSASKETLKNRVKAEFCVRITAVVGTCDPDDLNVVLSAGEAARARARQVETTVATVILPAGTSSTHANTITNGINTDPMVLELDGSTATSIRATASEAPMAEAGSTVAQVFPTLVAIVALGAMML
jgi:hypothetical protein